MNKKIVMWAAVMALVSGSALNIAAQEGPGDEEEVEMMEGGPGGAGGPEMGPGGPGRGQMRPGMRQEKKIRIKKMMREGKEGGPAFLSEDEAMAVIAKHNPDFAKKLENLSEIAPAKYKMIMQMSGKLFGVAKMEQDESIEKDAVRALALEFESKELSLKYNNASDADKKTIKESLRVKLAELFDLKSKGQELRVKHLEREVGKLKKNLESRKANKAKIVEQRLEQMTGEGYGW